jgi:hypothetical protein
MQDIDYLAPCSVKDTEWVANDCNDTNVGALRYARGGFGYTANAVNNIDQPALDSFSYRGTGTGSVVSRDRV